jgi:hypothetical protein
LVEEAVFSPSYIFSAFVKEKLVIIPAVGKTDTGGTWMKANQAVSERPYLQNKTQSQKESKCGLKYRAVAE